jgi:hypothetical protein
MGLSFLDHLGRSWNRVAGDTSIGAGLGGTVGGVAGGVTGAAAGGVGAIPGAIAGSGAGGTLGAIGGGIVGLGDALWNWHGDDVAADQAAAQQAPAAQAQPSALDALMKQRQDAAQAVHDRTNPFAGNAWQAAYNQNAQGIAGQGAQAEAAGLAHAGAPGGQMGLVAQTAARQQQGNALSALRANTQLQYQNMGNQWQQANDRDYQSALSGLYSDQAHQAELGYQHDEAANKNFGSFAGNLISGTAQFASSPLGNRLAGSALDALKQYGKPAATSYATYAGDGDYGPTPAPSHPIYPTPTGAKLGGF